MRLEDESAAVRNAFSAEYTDVAVAATTLAETSILVFALALLFWFSRRRETALVVSYAVAGIALVIGLKALLAMPRPPEEVSVLPASLEADEYGFPSGHAFAAVVVYGGLLSTFDLTENRPAVITVAILVVAVALSRVVLGVHYLGDVLVGAGVGLAFVFAMNRVTDGDPRIGFAVGVVLSIPAVVVTGAGQEALLGLGSAIGGVVGSTRLETLPPLRSRLEGAVLGVVGVGFVLAVTALESVVEAIPAAVVALYAVLVLGILLAPAWVGRLEV